MATSFFTRVSSGTGKTTVFARFQVPEQKIDYRASTKMEATIKAWTNSRLSAAKLENYKNSAEARLYMLCWTRLQRRWIPLGRMGL